MRTIRKISRERVSIVKNERANITFRRTGRRACASTAAPHGALLDRGDPRVAHRDRVERDGGQRSDTAANGATQETAAPSCWSIKQNYPASTDGTYWLRTNTLVQPLQVYCDMTTDGGGWELIGRGREGWSFADQRSADRRPQVRSPITGTGAFSPAASSTDQINGLMNGGRMDGLTDGLRIRRARNAAGTTWQDVRLYPTNYGQWSWGFGGGIYLNRMCFDGTCANISGSSYAGTSTRTAGTNSTDRRINTYPMQSHNWRERLLLRQQRLRRGEQRDELPVAVHERGPADPVRADVHPAPRLGRRRHRRHCSPTSGAARTDDPARCSTAHSVSLPWQVTDLNRGQTQLGAYVLGLAESGNTMFVGGKFRSVQHGPGGPKVTQSYLAAFNRDTGEFIPTFNPVINGPVQDIVVTADGKLIVAGEFTSVNGVATTGLAALNTTTGATIPGWSASVYRGTGASRTCVQHRHPGSVDLRRRLLHQDHGRPRGDAAGRGASLARVRVERRLPRWRLASDGRQRRLGHRRQPRR